MRVDFKWFKRISLYRFFFYSSLLKLCMFVSTQFTFWYTHKNIPNGKWKMKQMCFVFVRMLKAAEKNEKQIISCHVDRFACWFVLNNILLYKYIWLLLFCYLLTFENEKCVLCVPTVWHGTWNLMTENRELNRIWKICQMQIKILIRGNYFMNLWLKNIANDLKKQTINNFIFYNV